MATIHFFISFTKKSKATNSFLYFIYKIGERERERPGL